MDLPIKWIWEDERYGTFPYDLDRIEDALRDIAYTKGQLDVLLSFLDQDSIDTIEVSNITKEIMDSSKIEGEYLRRESVRASVAKVVQAKGDVKHSDATRQTDALVELLIDSRLNQEALTVERLHGWHNALFAHGRGEGVKSIEIAKFRTYDDMRVKEGAIGVEVTKYLAPPQKMLQQQIDALLDYIGTSTQNPYVKSAIAHLWFVSIHPYDDGNGRISRAIADYVLSTDSKEMYKAYSISSAIAAQRDVYYEMLDHTTNLHKNRDLNFTHWINWHTRTLQKAMEKSIENIQFIIEKTKFWDKHRMDGLNQRQIEVIEHFITPEKHEKTITTKIYMEMTKTPKSTAIRDIKSLLKLGCIEKIQELEGRNTAYRLVLPKESNMSLKQRYDTAAE
jgi:Fic family protein